MTEALVFALAGLAVGLPAYLGIWRSWTGQFGSRSWALAALWVGAGAALLWVGTLLPPESAASAPLVIAGGLIGCLGLCFAWWLPAPLRPRWYRAQYRTRRPQQR